MNSSINSKCPRALNIFKMAEIVHFNLICYNFQLHKLSQLSIVKMCKLAEQQLQKLFENSSYKLPDTDIYFPFCNCLY